MDQYELAKELATAAAAAICGTSGRATGAQLLEWLKEHRRLDASQVEKSWASLLTRMASDPSGPVMREPGRYGYLLRGPGALATQAPAPEPGLATDGIPITAGQPKPAAEATGPRERVNREQRLYQILVDWLDSKGYRAEDTSASRSGGAWGNPDVVGIRNLDTFDGALHFELATIEAKTSSTDWRRLFFEAVAHKRIADRVYFAFAVQAETPNASELPDFAELRDYGEKYRVGVLAVFFSPDDYATLVSGSAEDLTALSLDDARVEEVWPAIHDPASPFTQNRFLREVLEIDRREKLYQFGS